jgi:hypothetical protein
MDAASADCLFECLEVALHLIRIRFGILCDGIVEPVGRAEITGYHRRVSGFRVSPGQGPYIHCRIIGQRLGLECFGLWIPKIGSPRALELFLRILLASTAMPGVFPPTLIDVEVQRQPYQEMHVDGGAVS